MWYVDFIVVTIVAILVIAILAERVYLKKKANKLTKNLNQLSPYSVKINSEYELGNDRIAIDLLTDLNSSFFNQVISIKQAEEFASYYRPYCREACSLKKKLETFYITPSSSITKFIKDFASLENLVELHNEEAIAFLLDTHKDFFDSCLTYPLDKQQRRAIISEEENCLVVSSAGSGKTSSIVGKVKYLTEIKGVAPERILLISYTNKAAAELTERIATVGLQGYTFHKLAIDIVANATGVKPSICDNTDVLFVEIYQRLLEKTSFKKNVLKYFVDYQEEDDCEQRKSERQEYLSEQKNARLKALFPDMDGKSIAVKSEQEQKICFVLSSFGVKFRYEEPYEYQLADEKHSQYCPDFSIYFKQNGVQKRIYLEHFGVNENGFVPKWFAKENGITYAEANKKYNDGIAWKKAAHEKYGTILLLTSSADFYTADIRDTLRKLLEDAGVPIVEKTDEELYESLLPKGSKKEKAFIRLIVTFVTLLKSSCKSINDVLTQAKNMQDERGIFIIKNIFQPIYERYINALSESEQIDFTDVILRATEICCSSHSVEYDYIIVDEFQDISIDRYNFLKALRDGKYPAKLYCVGDDWQSIYRFSGSDMALFNQFSDYFGPTEINKIETTYRFGEPLVSLSSCFIQRNKAQVKKDVRPFNQRIKTSLEFYPYEKRDYCNKIARLVSSIPPNKSIFLLGRYSFDDYYLSFQFESVKEGNRFYYVINGRKIEFLTVHKSKGLEADYVILLQCNKDIYGFPSLIADDAVLNYVLTKSDQYSHGEERRLFYVAITRAKVKTLVLYDQRFPSVFVDEFLHPEKVLDDSAVMYPNANKKWTKGADKLLLDMHSEGKSVKVIAAKMGRSQTAIIMRLKKLYGQ